MKTKYYEFLKTISKNTCKDVDDVNFLSDKFDDFADVLEEEYNIDNSTNEEDSVMEHFNKFNCDIGNMLTSIENNELSIDEFNTFLGNTLSTALKDFS